ncbi:hypothetical protein [Nocardioides sp. B-3]|uniref:hypothetical protein n=1 Tax=Nocardioides sp. B-3 TaxID=2895565 RepID=UPI002152E47F|nr:hypothetical protein [Nocardioides sp. B-3]UUZ57951.1 hypothetical protein LP418_16600 [Nocardioides sp. B-3]
MVASRSARRAQGLSRGRFPGDGQDRLGLPGNSSPTRSRAPRAATSRRGGTRPRARSTYRPGGDNGYMAAMDRWIFHPVEKHPGVEAPCSAYLAAAQERLHERRA